MTALEVRPAPVTLEDKYHLESGRVWITGIQALVRSVLDQRRLDRSRGLDTAAFVSGYPGSPVGGVDQEFGRAAGIAGPAGVVFRPGLNEELAATAVAGTQLLHSLPGRRHDGITAFWYGKNPGLDRAADAIRHANLAGTAPLGGAVAWIGDDPACKSSTLPSSCEPMIRSLGVPLLAPATIGDILVLGLHAVALSRASGLWAGLKIVADLADGSATVDLPEPGLLVPVPDPARAVGPAIAVGTQAVELERDLLERRLPLAVAYARDHALNRVAWEPDRARMAIVAAGLSYSTTLRALDLLGVDEGARQRLGIRLVKLGMPWPLDPGEVRRLTAGVDQMIVVEEKFDFVEAQVKSALYRTTGAPEVVGRADRAGRPLLPADGALDADRIADALGRWLGIERDQPRARIRIPLDVHRSPYFCSGCPHNVSTRAGDDDLVGVGIGCHIMVALDDGGRGRLVGMTQMGGEGAHWLGLAPFTDDSHYTQNLGDGTFFHSGSLAVRAAVAAGVDVTYKLLHNDAVAMTGGQAAPGKMAVPGIAGLLLAEGVAGVAIVTPDPAAYLGAGLPGAVSVWHRDDMEKAAAGLAGTPGVTVLLYDDRCAAEERRLRKRGRLAAPAERVWINSRVCEGCGDCAEQSSCLSLTPTDTAFGRRMAVHQGSCNQDFSCVKGDCPSFVMVTPGPVRPAPAPDLPAALPEPRRPDPAGETLIRMPGIGGTGVVTVSQVLQMAGHLDGRYAGGLEQTGLAQKGGPVVSDIRISDRPLDLSVKAPVRAVDVLLAFDALSAAEDPTLDALDPGRTVAVVSTAEVPSAGLVRDVSRPYPVAATRDRIAASCRPGSVRSVPAMWLAERLFGDHLPANMVLVGAAYQYGYLPVTAGSVERAIELNGAAVATNLAAFRWGRAWGADPATVQRALGRQPDGPDDVEPLDDRLARWAADLEAYQSRSYARRYLDAVGEVRRREAEAAGAGTEVTDAFARQLYRLMAYKDEYEVARLHLDPEEKERLVRQFGPGARTRVMLHPPALKAVGLNRKISLGPATVPTLAVLRAGRRLRGTPFDPFGRTAMRRTERALIDEYRAVMARALPRLTPENQALVAELAAAPEEVRGYEAVKLAGVARFRARTAELLARIDQVE